MSIKRKIATIAENNQKNFDEKSNSLLAQNYEMQSCYCGPKSADDQELIWTAIFTWKPTIDDILQNWLVEEERKQKIPAPDLFKKRRD